MLDAVRVRAQNQERTCSHVNARRANIETSIAKRKRKGKKAGLSALLTLDLPGELGEVEVNHDAG
jgi:hypothetical protein